MTQAILPPGFEDLSPFVQPWGFLDTPEQRFQQRQTSSQDELIAFHAAIAGRLEAIFSHLDTFDVANLPEPQARLFAVALGSIEAAEAVEIFGQPLPTGASKPIVATVEWITFPSP